MRQTRTCVMSLNSPVQPGLSYRITYKTDGDQYTDLRGVELYSSHAAAHLGSAKSGFLGDALEENLSPTQLTLIYAHIEKLERDKAKLAQALSKDQARRNAAVVANGAA